MKKIIAIFLFLIFLSTPGLLKAHSVQVGYCFNCNGDLRIWVEHWHSTEDPSTTSMTLQLTVNGVTTTQTGSPLTNIQNTPAANLPGCTNPITIFASCPGQANTYNDWVNYDFLGMPSGVPITITILSGSNCFTADGCGMYPASTGIITIPPPPTFPNIVQCGGAGNTVGPFTFPAGNTWTNSNPGIGLPASGTGNIPAFTPTNSPTPQTATITMSNTCGNSSFTITINPAPTPNFIAPNIGANSLCPGQPVQFTDLSTPVPGSNIVSWNWAFGDGSPNSTQQNPIHTFPLTPLTYTVNLTVTDQNGCSSNISIPVNFGGPAANFTTANVCDANAVTFTDASTPTSTITNWNWDFNNDGIVDNTTQNPTFAYAAPGTYQVELMVVANGGCRDSVVLPVTVYPNPIANFNANDECLGTAVTFNDVSTILTGTITTWAWNFGDASPIDNTQNPTHNYAAAGIYNVNLTTTSNNGCTHNITIPVEVFTNPVANFSPTTVCAGQATPFTDLSTPGTGGALAAWSWDFDNNALVDDNNQNPNFTFAGPGNFPVNLTIVDAAGCVSNTTLNVSVSAQPTADFNFNHVCFGTATPFTDLSLPNGGTIANWNWDFTNNGTVDNTNQNPTNGYPVSGSYTVELHIATALGCVDSITKTVVVNPVPVVNFGPLSVCLNTPTTFTDLTQINAPGTFNNWVWDFGNSIGTSTLQNPTYTYPVAGVYNASLTVTSDSGCIGTIILPVTVFPNPTATFTTTNVCQNLAAQFTDQSVGNGGIINQWNWDFDYIAPNHTTDNTNQSPTKNYALAGTYMVELIVTTQAGCADTVSNPITIHPMPNAAYTFTNECFGTALPFTDNSNVSTGTITNWSWDFGNSNTSTMQSPSEMYGADGQYNVTLVVTTDNNCKDTVTQTINVWPLPIVDFSPTEVCLLEITQFNDLSTVSLGTNIAWNWNFDDGTNAVLQNPTHAYSLDGVYQVKLIVTTNYGCKDSLTKPVTVNPLPQVSFSADVVDGCTPVIVNFTDNSVINAPGNNVAWQWNFGNAGTSNLQNPAGINFINNSNPTLVTYNVSLTVTSDKGCVVKDSIINMISSFPIPEASFTSSPQPTNIYDSEVFFTDNSIIASQWLWDLGDGTSSTVQHPVHEYADSGLYTVVLYIENSYGCKDTTQKLVKIDPVFALWIPNTFTPDGDNINDFFFAKGYGIEILETLIFDRWGELVFEGYQLDSKWDGVYKGTLSKTEVYSYKIRARDIFGEWHEFVGRVNLLK